MKVAIMTDTNSGIYEKEAEQLGIFVIPMPVIIDGNISFEGVDLTTEMLCPLLKDGKKVTTSQPSTGDVINKWEEIFQLGYDEIVYIPMSSGLSSSCACAKAAADDDYEGRVYVVDNHRISVTQKASVIKAKRMADSGKTASEIADYLEKDAYNASIYISVENLDCLKRGGRITPAAAAIASVLQIKPVLTIQGEKLDSYAKVRGSMQRCMAKMIKGLKDDLEARFSQPEVEKRQIAVAGFGMTEEEKEHWRQVVQEAFPESDVFYDSLPASIGTHTGPGALGIGVIVDYKE